VEAGGSTVFPDLGVAVKPEKGACAVWYNLLRSGEGDFRTIHAGCPVLTGMKWIATKWFHEGGNEWNRSCDLDPNV
jgi:prolyl 4-hydroxylase